MKLIDDENLIELSTMDILITVKIFPQKHKNKPYIFKPYSKINYTLPVQCNNEITGRCECKTPHSLRNSPTDNKH